MYTQEGQVVSIAGTGTLVKVDARLVPGLSGLIEDSSPSGWVDGGLTRLLAGSLRVCGRGCELSDLMPHERPPQFHLLFIIPRSLPALFDVLQPGGMVGPDCWPPTMLPSSISSCKWDSIRTIMSGSSLDITVIYPSTTAIFVRFVHKLQVELRVIIQPHVAM